MLHASILALLATTALASESLGLQNGSTSSFASHFADPISEVDVERRLRSFTGAMVDKNHKARLGRITAALQTTFQVMPKEKNGRLGHQTARYALHRFMMQARGWFLRGLEESAESSKHERGRQTEWVFGYLQKLVERRSGLPGASLKDLAVMAATIEELVHGEVASHMKAVYGYLGLSTEKPEERALVQCAVEAFVVYSVTYNLKQRSLAMDPFNMTDDATVHDRRQMLCDDRLLLAKVRPDLLPWTTSLLEAVAGTDDSAPVAFKEAISFVYRFTSDFQQENERECKALKQHLVTMEEIPGRVPLSSYQLLGGYRHWSFSEPTERLMEAGVLDGKKDSAKPNLVVPNYVSSRLNCIESSTMYASCCKIECDDVLTKLEHQLGSSSGKAEKIARLVSAIGTLNVLAPRALSLELKERLATIEKTHAGRVPIHSEAFAIWLHHAYPRDCPLPHPDKSSSHPMTAGEWLHVASHSWAEESQAQAVGVSIEQGGIATSALLLVVSAISGTCWYALRPKEHRDDVLFTDNGGQLDAFSQLLRSLLVEKLGREGVAMVQPWLGVVSLVLAAVVLVGGISLMQVVLSGSFFAACRSLLQRQTWVGAGKHSKVMRRDRYSYDADNIGKHL